ncbi:dockerin type I domain-containing protein [Fontivita pretiosa]|uniref:dockerin type I domain-containing protein n=1 Tax=Fontivita pretiosa TaxID=2989684 RepID=UPI003D16D220
MTMRPKQRLGIVSSAALAVGSMAAPAQAVVFYDATTRRLPPSGSFAYFYNPGPDNGGAPNHIVFDDVTVPVPTNDPTWPSTLFNVKRITFGVSRRAGAPAVTITPYYAELLDDSVRAGGPGDGPNYDPVGPLPLGPVQIGSPINLPTNINLTHTETTITIGDGVNTLFNVNGAAASTNPLYRSFALGLRFSTSDDKNGWTLASHPDNLDLLWDYFSNSSFYEFTYDDTDDAGLIYGTQYLKVEGLVLSGVAGDATVDGVVNIRDLYALAQHWQQPGDYTQGDFNFDNFVNQADLEILAQNWQASFPPPFASLGLPEVTVSIPEPLGAAALGGALLLCRRRQRRTRAW